MPPSNDTCLVTRTHTSIRLTGGLGPGGLLLATLPLILAPMLSYLFTPMVIPVTATIAAGKRRRKRNIQTNVPLDSDPDFNQTFLTINSSPAFMLRRLRETPDFVKAGILGWESMPSHSSHDSGAASSFYESDPNEAVKSQPDRRGLHKTPIPLTYARTFITPVHERELHSQSEANKGMAELQLSRKKRLRIPSSFGRGL